MSCWCLLWNKLKGRRLLWLYSVLHMQNVQVGLTSACKSSEKLGTWQRLSPNTFSLLINVITLSFFFYFDINTLTTTLEILFKIKIINLLSNLFFYFTFKFIKQMLSQIEIKTSKFINKCWEYILKCK